MKFSVLMSVYKKEESKYLDACFESISQQTLLPDEIILVEDGPLTKELYETINSWKTKLPILKTLRLENNHGLPFALNKGLKICENNYIARMDSNDICLPNRFEKQIAILQKDSSLAILGCQISEFNENMDELIGYRNVPLKHQDIIKFIKKRSPFNHVTVIFKKNTIEKVGGYPEHLKNWQDYALWSLVIAKGYKTRNTEEVLVKVRTGDNLYTRRSGLKYLKYELQAYHYVYKTGLVNFVEYITITILKIFVRLLPVNFLKLIYRIFLRNK